MMKRIALVLLCFSFTKYHEAMSHHRTKKALQCLTIAAAIVSAPETYAATNSSSSFIDTLVYKGVLPTIGQSIYLSSMTGTWWRDLINAHIEPQFCTNTKTTVPPLKTIDDPDVQTQDFEQYIPLIKRYAPVAYLHEKESYLPIHVNELCCGEDTAIVSTNGNVIVPPGKVTNELLDAYGDNFNPGKTEELASEWGTYYYSNSVCKRYGSDPKLHQDTNKNLILPCYVITSETTTHIYLQFFFIYGFNGPYSIGPFEGNIAAIQDAHEGDLEHISIEIDAVTHNMTRIFYAAHSDPEGFWLDAQHPDVSYEDGHPVTFSARHSHANYPKAGTYVRIYGTGNDETGYGLRWTPQLVRVYRPDDPRYNASAMAWVSFAGRMGNNGPLSPWDHYWFTRALTWDTGSPYDKVLFCKSPKKKLSLMQKIAASLKQSICILSKIPQSFIPQGGQNT